MDDQKPALDVLHGCLVLAPLVALALPPSFGIAESFFQGAPDPLSIGVGIAALGVLPATLMALLRRRGDRALLLAPLLVMLVAAGLALPRAADSFGAWRALIGLAAGFGFVVSGAALGPAGRRTLQVGLTFAGLSLILSAPFGTAWTGALGNTGDLSEAALPCAILGAGTFLDATGAVGFAGFAAIISFALYAGLAPVYAGLVSLAAAAAAAACAMILGRRGGETGRQAAARRFRILLVATLVGLLPVAYRSLDLPMPPGLAPETTEAVAPGTPAGSDDGQSTTGGFEFRRLTWAKVPALIFDHPRFGAGPGQFQAAFPPYRDPREIELSSMGRAEPTPIEVEHAHNDWLTGLAEYGGVGGGAFALFLLITLLRGLMAASGEDRTRRDFGLAAVAILVNACFNSPLLYGPAAPAMAFAIFGVISSPAAAREEAAKSRLRAALGILVPAATLAGLCALAPRALGLFQYGRTLAEIPEARIVLPDGREKLDAVQLGSILERALALAPKSPLALEKEAELLSLTAPKGERRRKVLEAWTEARPASFAAQLAMGVLAAQTGRVDDALTAFGKAHAVDRSNPVILRNRVRAACDARAPELVKVYLAELMERGQGPPAFLRAVCIEQLVAGRLGVGGVLVKEMTAPDEPGPVESDGRVRPAPLMEVPVDILDPDQAYAAMESARREGDDELATAYEVAFQMDMALQHLMEDRPGDATRSARQAYQRARDFAASRLNSSIDYGPVRLRLGAAQAAAALAEPSNERQRLDGARAVLGEGPIRPRDVGALTNVERTSLEGAGISLSGSQGASAGPPPPK